MVKLASVRGTRAYGPGESKDIWEDVNAFGYLIGALLLTVGTVLLLPGYSISGGFWLILVGLVFIFIVNFHDLYAQLAGFDYRFDLVTLDTQLAWIEILSPILQAAGTVLYFVGAFFLLRVARGDYGVAASAIAYKLIIAALALWVAGSLLNSFQLFENTELNVQAYQKGTTLPFLIGSLLLLISAIVSYLGWHPAALHTSGTLAATLAITGAGLLLFGAVVNAVRVIKLQSAQQSGARVEKLRGGAQETLVRRREDEGLYAQVPKDDHYAEIESGGAQTGNPYRARVVPAASLGH